MTMIDVPLYENERIDDLQLNGLHIIQNTMGFCFGVDAVLLSDFCKDRIGKGAKVLDMGTGTGIIPILLTEKTKASHFTAIDIQEQCVDMASRSVLMNGLSDRMDVRLCDIKAAGDTFPAASFDVITTNPPYMIADHGLLNPNEPKNISRHEILCDLKDIVSNSAKLLCPGGRLFMIHKPFRLVEIFEAMRENKIEPKRMQLVHSYIDKEPTMVMIEGIRGGNPRLKIEPPIIMYKREEENK